MRIAAIDPGTFQSAWLIYDTETKLPTDFGIYENQQLLEVLGSWMKGNAEILVIEQIRCYGMAVGQTTFDTVQWTGRFIERWGLKFDQIPRSKVKMHLCHSMRAKDGNVRQAIIDRYEPTGGGKVPQIGVKAQKGPLFGIAKDIWSSLAVAITYHETHILDDE